MKLRSNKIIQNECYYCVQNKHIPRYYPNEKWGSCSRCFQERQPDKWLEFLATQWCPANTIPQYALENFLDDKCITQKTVIKMIEIFLKNFELHNAHKLLVYQLKHNNKWGISAKQAAEMYSRFKEANGEKYGKPGRTGQQSDWKIQHLFAGFIIDKWNITSDSNGPIAYCYYSNFGAKPRGTIKKLSPCVALQIGDLSGCNKPKSQRFDFWMTSVASICQPIRWTLILK